MTHPAHTFAVSDRYLWRGIRAFQSYCRRLLRQRNSTSLSRLHVRAFSSITELTMPSADFCRLIALPPGGASPRANRQTSPGIAHPPSRLCPPHIRQDFPCRYRTLSLLALSSSLAASYAISVRQASVLPAASSGFHLAMDTLAVRLTIPPAGLVEDFHLQVNAPCRAHQQIGRAENCTAFRKHSLQDTSAESQLLRCRDDPC